jgi:hypothetical protein
MAQLDLNLNTQNSAHDNLYHIALQCEENKKNGCANQCGACPFNVVLYTESMREAALIKTTAMVDAHKKFEYQQNQSNAGIGGLIIIVMIISWFVFTCSPKKTVNAPKNTAKTELVKAKPKNLSTLIKQVRQDLRDVNDDGLLNCIDYAVIFYEKYNAAFGEGAHIIVNQNNPYSDMNHLFNAVETRDGSLIYVEPQSESTNTSPDNFWGIKYNPEYNRDMTYFYKQYANY